MEHEDWRARAARMGRTTARVREGHMPDVQVWSTRRIEPTRDPCITCGDPLDTGAEAIEVFTVEGVRLLFHADCHDMWTVLRQRSSRRG